MAVLCATITECGCFVVCAGGGRGGGTEGGGPMGTGRGQGGRCMSCTCPGCRPGAASSVEYAPVAIAMTPDACDPRQTFKQMGPVDKGQRDSPLELSYVSHSPYLFTLSPISKTTTRLRSATASQPRRQASPLTFSLNSSSATSFPRASFQNMTLLGGYRGSLPPPTKNKSDEQCIGTTEDSMPPLTSVKE
jgi:hypothetical protein